MKSETVLDFAVFQLTPTRTRCELLISSNGTSEKLAAGLLKPFLAHLRTAEEQIAVGGYSIRLEPPTDGGQAKASWFTKGTMQRFVRFVSTPEVLERVSNVETELIQLEEELSSYANEADDQQSVAGSVVTTSGGGKSFSKQSKARKDGDQELEGENNETSRCRLIKAMESRHSVLQREQGMAFARAVAAGFDMDRLSDLLAFAEYFGAARLSEACHKFAALCKKQQEGGLWLDEMELVAAEGAYAYPEANGTGITITPAGLAPLKSMIEASKAQDQKGADNPGDEAHQRQPSLSDQHSYHGYPQMMGMPPGQMPPYAPWMHYSGEQGYDPRFMPQNPYMNGNYGQMNPYWGVPPPGSYNNTAKANGEAEEEEEEEEVEEKSRKNGRKSNSPRRRTSSPLKKVQVGRSGKRSGMVLIRNINYITGSQDQPGGNKTKGAENETDDESSEFETSSEIDQGGKQHYSEDRSSRNNNKKKIKKSRRQSSSVPAATEISSEGSHASATGKDTTDETYFSVPGRGGLQSGGNSYSFDSESLPQGLEKRRGDFAPDDDSYMLNGDGRSYGRSTGDRYGAEDQLKSRNLASADGVVLPGRNQAGRFGSGNHDSELAFRKAGAGPGSLDDSFIIPQRSGLPDAAHPVGESYQRQNRREESKDTAPDAELQDLFIVPSRPAVDNSEAARRTLDLGMPADQLFVQTKEKPESPKYEAEDMWILPERSVGRESLEKRWSDVNVEMEAMSAMQPKPEPVPVVEEEEEEAEAEEFYEQYHEQRDAKLMKDAGPKRAEREARLRSLQETLDKRKTELSSRFKATRSSILKTKKEREEAERKRLEEAAEERRNRIAARSGGGAVRRSLPAMPSSATKPLTRALSSKTTSTSSGRKPEPGRPQLSRSVTSLEVRKENAKPAAARQPAKTGSEPSVLKSTPAAAKIKPAPLAATRKSIASVRELAKPEALKASKSVDLRTSIGSRTSQKEGSSILQASSRSASSRSLKAPAPPPPPPPPASQAKASEYY